MKFDHIVVINQPGNPAIPLLTREELWFGLLCRAEDPRAFLPGLERCDIIERQEHMLVRDLHFGALVVRDRVVLEPMTSVRFEAERTEQHDGGLLTISIEEPRPDELTLRFLYETTHCEKDEKEAAYHEFIKSAYHESDIDTVRVIRMIAESGRIQ